MAQQKIKEIVLPEIGQEWYDFEIDPNTLRPIHFSWGLASGPKTVAIYDSESKDRQDVQDISLRRWITSNYFVLDKENKRIFAYPIVLSGHNTRASCVNAHYEKLNTNSFYMFDENKQIWEIPKREYQKYIRYDYGSHRSIYETIEAKPRKASRLSTANYKIQCQLTSHIISMFSELYGPDFIYQHHALGDSDIRENNYKWIGWLTTKGKKYSDKTIKYVDGLMGKFDSSRRHLKDATLKTAQCLVRLEFQNGITALCYFSHGEETFRQIFQSKTCKMENFTWKQDKWQKANKLPGYIGVNCMCISESYCNNNTYDYEYLLEAKRYYEGPELSPKRYTYSPAHSLYYFILNYISNPVIHQILQISNETSRERIYLAQGKIEPVYGAIPSKGRTLFKKLGVSKCQFNNTNGIPYIKSTLKTNDISHIDDETWLQCTQVFKDLKSLTGDDMYILDFLNNNNEFSLHRWIKINKLANQHIERSPYHYYLRSPVKQLYKDYYMSLNTIKEFGTDISSFPLFFNDMKQLQRYHDEAARITSSIKNKGNDKKFQLLYNQRQEMLENDGQYLIDMPKCCADLTEEGRFLHHCVSGYANSVANGNTAIYFLRKASEPNTPWLTVEVQNKRCKQIHGSCNAWMGSKDEYFDAVPFLHYWFTKHKIVCDEHLLTNKATGYSSCGSKRDMPWEAIYAYSQSKKLKKS